METQQNRKKETAGTPGNFFDKKSIFGWNRMGCHRERDGLVFRVWAPHAAKVNLMGSFNEWNPETLPMEKAGDGVWECHAMDYPVYSSYKYLITTSDGRKLAKADPYAFHTETAPQNASKVYPEDGYEWGDGIWQSYREKSNPVTVYRLDVGHWKKDGEGHPLSYEQLGRLLIPYVKKMGYTHVSFMPLAEHPDDDPVGRKPTGFFAPTSRYGHPRALKTLVDSLHQAGVGVLFDLPLFSFGKEDYGLENFDGQPCYEGAEPWEKGIGTFDLSKPEVVRFLTDAADFWLTEYHGDGLCLSGDGEKESPCVEKQAFLNSLKTRLAQNSSHAAVFVQGKNGLFPLWDTEGRDLLLRIAEAPLWDRCEKDRLLKVLGEYMTHGNRLLPLCPDVADRSWCRLAKRMPGDYGEIFAGLRTLMGLAMACPGGKLTFMGEEFAPFAPWQEREFPEWFMTDFPAHQAFLEYTARLNEFVLCRLSLWDNGVRWLTAPDTPEGTAVILCKNQKGGLGFWLICLIKELPATLTVPVTETGTYTCLFSSEDGEGTSCVAKKDGHAVTLALPAKGLACSFWQKTDG